MRPLIHIGYIKTGSTWLQHRLFYGPNSRFLPVLRREHLIDRLVRPSRLYYDEGDLLREVQDGVRTSEEEGLMPVLSHERLAGVPVSGGFDAYEIMSRLHALLPDARVLIVIREQASHVLSSYQEYVNQGGASSLKQFLRPYDRVRFPGFDWRFFCYHHLITHYMRLFGTKSVLVLPFESLKANPREFIEAVSEFIGLDLPLDADPTPIRSSKNLGRLGIDRRLNTLFFRTDINPAAPFHWPTVCRISGLVPLLTPPGTNDWLKRRYMDKIRSWMPKDIVFSNQEIQTITGLDLGRHGYWLPT